MYRVRHHQQQSREEIAMTSNRRDKAPTLWQLILALCTGSKTEAGPLSSEAQSLVLVCPRGLAWGPEQVSLVRGS